MDDIIFVYKKGSQFKVLSLDRSSGGDRKLKDDGWKHISTISASMWLEELLNSSQREQRTLVEEILYKD